MEPEGKGMSGMARLLEGGVRALGLSLADCTRTGYDGTKDFCIRRGRVNVGFGETHAPTQNF